jgi:hypothetical protein
MITVEAAIELNHSFAMCFGGSGRRSLRGIERSTVCKNSTAQAEIESRIH